MVLQDFEKSCWHLERLGYTLVELEPHARYAKYIKNGHYEEVGKKRTETPKKPH